MPKITTHGGATNAGEPGYFEDIEAAQAEPVLLDDVNEPVEVLRIEDEPESKPVAKKATGKAWSDAPLKGATDA